MQRYELAILQTSISVAAKAAPGVEAFCRAPEAGGRLLGLWATEIGALNQLYVLRGFRDDAELSAERQRTLHAANPFGASEFLQDLSLETHAPFPDLPPVETGAFGPFYEVRTYRLLPGALPRLLDNWRPMLPARREMSRLVTAMYALDGAPRFSHIWAYGDLNQRAAVRADAIARGVWPPPGGAQVLKEMRSTITLAVPGSPLG